MDVYPFSESSSDRVALPANDTTAGVISPVSLPFNRILAPDGTEVTKNSPLAPGALRAPAAVPLAADVPADGAAVPPPCIVNHSARPPRMTTAAAMPRIWAVPAL